jgi:anaerobic selenocysteine-containing dehydrogenase
LPWAEHLPAEQAELEPRSKRRPVEAEQSISHPTRSRSDLELIRYRPLFSGPAVERIKELEFQRPAAEVELGWEDAEARDIVAGEIVSVQSNGTSRELRARVNRTLMAGVVRIAEDHAVGLEAPLSIKPVAKRRV